MKLLFSSILCICVIAVHAQSLQANGNTLILNDNNAPTTISDHAVGESAFVYKNKVYFLDNDKSKITVYDIASQQSKDIISVGMKTDNGYTIRTEILNVVPLVSAGKLYFSTMYMHSGEPVHTTWQYDIEADNYYIFRDGIIDVAHNDGTLEIVSHGKDYNGEYTERFYYYHGNAKLIKSDERVYK